MEPLQEVHCCCCSRNILCSQEEKPSELTGMNKRLVGEKEEWNSLDLGGVFKDILFLKGIYFSLPIGAHWEILLCFLFPYLVQEFVYPKPAGWEWAALGMWEWRDLGAG